MKLNLLDVLTLSRVVEIALTKTSYMVPDEAMWDEVTSMGQRLSCPEDFVARWITDPGYAPPSAQLPARSWAMVQKVAAKTAIDNVYICWNADIMTTGTIPTKIDSQKYEEFARLGGLWMSLPTGSGNTVPSYLLGNPKAWATAWAFYAQGGITPAFRSPGIPWDMTSSAVLNLQHFLVGKRWPDWSPSKSEEMVVADGLGEALARKLILFEPNEPTVFRFVEKYLAWVGRNGMKHTKKDGCAVAKSLWAYEDRVPTRHSSGMGTTERPLAPAYLSYAAQYDVGARYALRNVLEAS